jgi:pyruvate/2-oxoglutarate/acetoin dehydrogenase E1 component
VGLQTNLDSFISSIEKKAENKTKLSLEKIKTEILEIANASPEFKETFRKGKKIPINPEITAEIVDLRTLLPLDTEAIYAAARKTGKVIVLHEDCMTGGIGGELVALITENCFQDLDAPVKRVASLDTPVPFAVSLETQFLPKERLREAINALLAY